MKEYKTTILDGYILIVDESEIKVGDFITDNYIINKWLDDSSLLGKRKIIAHLPLFNYAVLKGVPLLPPIKKDDDVEKLAEERFGTDIDSIKGSNPYDLNSDLKRGFTIGYNKHAEKYKYTEQDLRIAVELAITTGLTVDYFIARHKQPKFPTKFICETEPYTVGEMSTMPLGTVNQKPKTITTTDGKIQWVGEWIY
jgi:hypothetical protein